MLSTMSLSLGKEIVMCHLKYLLFYFRFSGCKLKNEVILVK